MVLAQRLEAAERIAREAGAQALAYFNRRDALVVEQKRHMTDLVSESDRTVEALIRVTLTRDFPDDAQLGEEHGLFQGTSGFTWSTDPINVSLLPCFLHDRGCWIAGGNGR